ncbi:Zn-dependent hydrolase [Azorhizobium oxalatiphilum]|uniref:Zn-dependent hydrolase n=1 Tax=Azorhizobium oxalatiphilum TaxID=980631 RepID=A0A917CHH4_9HYPH|nr:Zn-dependent hydrolase [Azorhizobium oxalatiphilum]
MTAVGAAVSAERVVGWQRRMDAIGATANGGVHRLALGDTDLEARAALIEWAQARGYDVSTDAVANLFITRAGRDADAPPVLCGSHTDSQPYAGRFDGMYGVLAAVETLQALDDAGIETAVPVTAVVWTGEEGGARYPVGTLGSSAFTGRRTLDETLGFKDADGITLGEAVRAAAPGMVGLRQRPLGFPIKAYVEIHIEQGRVLEEAGLAVGIVSGIQGMRRMAIEVVGAEAHSGTTPRRHRRDALQDAIDIITDLRAMCMDDEDAIRFTVGKLSVYPNAASVVPGRVSFVVDLRHTDRDTLERLVAAFAERVKAHAGACTATATMLATTTDPLDFDAGLVAQAEGVAQALGLPTMQLVSGANHDAGPIAGVCPQTLMLFIPCRDGVSHNEAEHAEDEHLVAGTRVHAQLVADLASA